MRICDFCGKELEYHETPVTYENKNLHYFCYKVKKFVLENEILIKNLLDEKSNKT